MSELIEVLHVMMAATWFGGQVYVEGLMASAARTKDPVVIMTVGGKVGQTSLRLFTIAGVLVFLTGIFMVFDSKRAWEFEMLFVVIGFVVAVLVMTLGVFYFKPKGQELGEIIREHGLTSELAMAKAKQIGNISHVATLLLTIALIVMVLKLGV